MTPYYRKRFFPCIAMTFHEMKPTQCRLDKSHVPRLPHNNNQGHTWTKFKGMYEK